MTPQTFIALLNRVWNENARHQPHPMGPMLMDKVAFNKSVREIVMEIAEKALRETGHEEKRNR